MSKQLTFQFQGTIYDVLVERRGNSLILTREGRTYQVDLIDETQTISNQHVSAVPRSAAPPVSRSPAPTASPAPAVSPRPEASMPPPDSVGEEAERAPITGTIKEIKVAPGDQVKDGQLIILMEAMKMDIEVFAAKSGTVKTVLVNPGDSVKEKQPLVTLG